MILPQTESLVTHEEGEMTLPCKSDSIFYKRGRVPMKATCFSEKFGLQEKFVLKAHAAHSNLCHDEN